MKFSRRYTARILSISIANAGVRARCDHDHGVRKKSTRLSFIRTSARREVIYSNLLLLSLEHETGMRWKASCRQRKLNDRYVVQQSRRRFNKQRGDSRWRISGRGEEAKKSSLACRGRREEMSKRSIKAPLSKETAPPAAFYPIFPSRPSGSTYVRLTLQRFHTPETIRRYPRPIGRFLLLHRYDNSSPFEIDERSSPFPSFDPIRGSACLHEDRPWNFLQARSSFCAIGSILKYCDRYRGLSDDRCEITIVANRGEKERNGRLAWHGRHARCTRTDKGQNASPEVAERKTERAGRGIGRKHHAAFVACPVGLSCTSART